MVEAVVEYNYNASEPDELTIAKGDVIREIVKKSGGWWEGTLRDKRGMFPDNFVTLIQKEHKASVRQQHKQKALRQCRAIFSYNPAHDDELKLNFGDLIDVLCEVEEGWWKGRLGHFEGVFPSNFVEEIEKSSSSKEDLTSLTGETGTGTPNLPPKPTRIICQAKYPYDACNDDELSLKEGDRITLISKDGQDRGWWRGELRGRVGVFPDNFVVVLPAVDQNGSPHTGKDKKHSVDLCNTASARMSISPQIGNDEPKHTNVASQRKSLELKTDDHRIPPLPGKKPNVPKKSPSSTGNTSVLAGLKQKLVDRVDGVASSRLTSETKGEDGDVDFDQVERSAMLPDMRANRAKAPGRRPPSVVYRDAEQPNLVNGNDHSQAAPISVENDDDDDDKKQPKVREWEKHKAPWVDELKLLNQVKRPGDPPRLKPNESDTEPKQKSPSLQHEFSPVAVPVDMSKSMSALSSKLKPDIADKSLSPNIPIADKSPTNVPVLRTKPPAQPSTPARPQSIHVVESSRLSISPNSQPTTTPSPKPPVADKDPVKLTSSPRSSIDKKLEVVTMRQYLELQDRILQMEAKMSQQYQQMQGTIDELKAKLQVETDMRRLLQSELEKVAQCVTQV